MCTSLMPLARIVVTLVITGLMLPVNAADAKPDRRKSQVAYQRGMHADEALRGMARGWD